MPGVLLAYARGEDLSFQTIRFLQRYNPGTSDVLDVWAAINENGVGQTAVINVYLPLQSRARSSDDTEWRLIPFLPATSVPAVHLTCVTLDLYLEDPDTKAYETWTPGAVMDILGLVAYSWGFWGDLCPGNGEDDDLPTVDIIGVRVKMAKQSVKAVSHTEPRLW